ncbi:hypothetical protein GCM10009676_42910 [Prauserella halophila]|uniref:Uncharacterized protein n=1 Tax=Prauserella halophila TaxID=185641 RepID=A0ABN1WJQ0_9PSEU
MTIRIVFDVMLRARGVNTLLESGARNACGGHHRPALPILRGYGSRYGCTKGVSAAGFRTPALRVSEGEGEKVRVDSRSAVVGAGLGTTGLAAARAAVARVVGAGAVVSRAVVSGVASAAGRP